MALRDVDRASTTTSGARDRGAFAMVWIDGDLDATSRELAALGRTRADHAAGATVTDMDATLETITPWQWDWFDRT